MTMGTLRFTKMHGIGNDYVYIDCFTERVPDPAALARRVSPRRTGIGADGVILICPSTAADARMEMYNADGSRGEMCGNGIRCVARYVYDHGIARRPDLRIDTDAGTRTLELHVRDGRVRAVTVDMGEPILDGARIPVAAAGQVIDAPLRVGAVEYRVTCVSMGNPHAVICGVPLKMLNEHGPAGWNLEVEGRRIETAALFSERTNVHFVDPLHPGEVRMLTWERGSGATQACGTGASAVCVAGVLTKRNGRKITAHLPGGDLAIEWSEADNHVYMTGPAVEIFTGDWPE